MFLNIRDVESDVSLKFSFITLTGDIRECFSLRLLAVVWLLDRPLSVLFSILATL